MNEYIEENFNIRPLFSVSNFQPVREKRGKKKLEKFVEYQWNSRGKVSHQDSSDFNRNSILVISTENSRTVLGNSLWNDCLLEWKLLEFSCAPESESENEI